MTQAKKRGVLFRKVVLLKRVSIFLDGLAVFFGFFMAASLCLNRSSAMAFFGAHGGLIALLTLPVLLVFYLSDVYSRFRIFSNLAQFVTLWKTALYAVWIQIFLILLVHPMSFKIVIPAFFFELWFITLSKGMMSFWGRNLGPRERVLVVGYSHGDEQYFRSLKKSRRAGKTFMGIVGIVGEVSEEDRKSLENFQLWFLGGYDRLIEIMKHEKVTTLVISPAYAGHKVFHEFLEAAFLQGIRLIALEDFYADVEKKIPYALIHKPSLLAICLRDERYAWQKKKRICDVLLSASLLVLLSPLAILIALGIKLCSPGPVFYIQERVGFRGGEFKMYKFRSMRMFAERQGVCTLVSKKDARVTPFGRFLRNTHLDEIPQLWNVLKGEMSFVGPRPERKPFIEKIERRIPQYALRLYAKPGITGWAQVSQGYAGNLRELREKLSYDLYYIKNMSTVLDIQIILSTVKHLFLALGR